MDEKQPSVVELLSGIVSELNEAKDDAAKFDAGNGAAGTRVRKAALKAKNDLHSIRAEIAERKRQ